MKTIDIVNARVHNLKNISLSIPRNSLTVITGPSGSGKSSLAFDTIYAEGQRRYIESLSSYARQFLGQIQPPDVDSITGLSPAIAIDQKSTTRNPRSTVGTVTEIYDYLRVLYAKIATAHSPATGKPLNAQSAQQMVETISALPKGSKIQILAPIVKNKKGEHKEELAKYQSLGYSKVRINDQFTTLDENISISKTKHNNIDLVIDRIIIKDDITKRLTDSVEQALRFAHGSIIVNINEKEDLFLSEINFCHDSQKSYPELEPRLFSFNSPLGACETCNGLGESKVFDRSSLVFDASLSINDGAIPALAKGHFLVQMIKSIAKAESVNLDTPLNKLPKTFLNILFDGTDKVYTYNFESENSSYKFKKNFAGIVEWLNKKYMESASDKIKAELENYMRIELCPSCQGKKLNPYALAAKIQDYGIMDICNLSIDESLDFFNGLKLTGHKLLIAEKLLKEIKDRLHFLLNVGLNYLTLNRSAKTLSGGESQRIRLATQIGSALSGVIYVLDEPSIGLHQRDNTKLIKTLRSLKDIGNTVIVVEHDEETIRAADYLIDMGPAAGLHGGNIVDSGTFKEVLKNNKTLTTEFLNGSKSIEIPKRREPKEWLQLKGAREHNLKNLNLKIPLSSLVCVTGVSGSGKSTLVHKVLVPAIRNILNNNSSTNTNYQSLTGTEKIESIIELDQSPIGRTPHSNPATYTGLFDDIRNIFTQTNEAKIRGYKAGRFSFNVKGGRCETCEGNGVLKIEMHFLPDVYITCNECGGKRYNRETLSVLYRGKNISEVLEMSIEEGCEFFVNHPKIFRKLDTLNQVGLGYMKLGQPATTLSGGEAQRLKLAKELSRRPKGHCFYVLDEPTTGLHFQDIKVLLIAIQKLIENGHSALVIEHNLDVIKTADYVVDLGPEGGKFGGNLLAVGTPEEVAKVDGSYTGQYLKTILKKK
ncbi:MAG: excinuclease ABC subunit UvrA [Bacteriovoracaceae bacterium]|nr:excinuclease ABC subunit UvrA [Bacteriovoracaceae bacterium]